MWFAKKGSFTLHSTHTYIPNRTMHITNRKCAHILKNTMVAFTFTDSDNLKMMKELNSKSRLARTSHRSKFWFILPLGMPVVLSSCFLCIFRFRCFSFHKQLFHAFVLLGDTFAQQLLADDLRGPTLHEFDVWYSISLMMSSSTAIIIKVYSLQ